MRWQFRMVVLGALASAACLTANDSLTASEGNGASSSSGGGRGVERDAVSVTVERTRGALLQSADGTVTLRVPALAVAADVTLTLARLEGPGVPVPRVGEGYLFRVEGGALAVPARVEWKVRPEVSVPVAELRIAAADAWGALVPLPGAQAVAGVVAAELGASTTLALVDRRAMPAGWAEELPAPGAGDALLWTGDMAGARAAYHTARSRGVDAHASLGRAVTDLLLMAGAPPVSDLLLRCGLEGGALFSGIVGEGGVLAQAAADRAGSALLVVADAAGETPLVVDEVYARRSAGDGVVTAVGPAGWLRVVLPAGVGGTSVRQERAQFGGTVELVHGGDRFVWTDGAAGAIRFRHGGGAGGVVDVGLEDVVLAGAPGAVTLRGTVNDVVTEVPSLGRSLGLTSRTEPRVEGVLEQFLAGCGADVTEGWLRGAAADLADRLAPVAADLADAALAEGVVMTLPSGLTRLPRGIPLTAVDARLLRAAVQLVRAALLGLGAYRVAGLDADGGTLPLNALVRVGEVHRFDADGGISVVPALVLDAERVATELNSHLLEPVAVPVALEESRTAVGEALDGLVGAMLQQAGAPDGLVRLSAWRGTPLAADWGLLLTAALQSLPVGAAGVGLGGVTVHLSRLFDQPLDHARLAAGNRGEPLLRVVPGAADARVPQRRDPALRVHERGALLAAWSAAFTWPPALAETCQSPADSACGVGWTCSPDELGACGSSYGVCVDNGSCALPDEACVLPHRCRPALPPAVDWGATFRLVRGPGAAGWAPGAWHLVQPLWGGDPAARDG
ncbi:MAG: hypothetical protein HY904_00045 [Deltaproteobacteria bacterium]|nr:hypothetical protein [Deltaproteobacteria bacterium]